MIALIFCLTLTGHLVLGQDLPLRARSERFSEKLPGDFRGALFICSPFCELFSVRLGDEEWNPPLDRAPAASLRFYLLPKDDPLFAILFPEKMVGQKTEEAPQATMPIDIEKKDQEKKEAQKKARAAALARPPRTAFDNGFRLSPALRYQSISQSSNSTVQADFHPQTGLYELSMGLGYLREKPIGFLSKWWQFELGYELDLYSSSTKVGSSSLKQNQNELFLIPWIKEKRYSWGPRLSMLTENLLVSENSLGAYSYKENSNLIGLSFKYKRVLLDADYAFGFKISEQQPFRSGLKEALLFRLSASYCQTAEKLWGFLLTPCYDLAYLQSKTSASLAPDLDPSQTATIQRHEVFLKVILNYGEDFFR